MKRVVVTGMGAVTPIGNEVASYWESLKNGVCGIGPITHFDTREYKVHLAAEVKNFDPLSYMNREQMRKNDLYTRYAIAASIQAMEDSGMTGKVDPYRFGVYIGSGIGGIETLLSEVDKMKKRGPERVSPFLIPMMISNMAAGVVAIQHGAKGPTLPVVTACATATNTIGEAYRAIQLGEADAIIAGGAEAPINGLSVAGFSNSMALTQQEDATRASIPFDRRRNGFVMGEGAGILVLEEYQHAQDRGAKMYGEMVGYGNTCDAYHVTAPDPEGMGAMRAMEMAVRNVDFSRVTKLYINAHGTSTPMNDRVETMAMKQVFSQYLDRILVSSTKSMTGHMLGAAGGVEAIAGLLAMKHGVIPPTIGYQEPDPECDLDVTPNVARVTTVDLVLSTSLGFGGHNACIAFSPVREVL